MGPIPAVMVSTVVFAQSAVGDAASPAAEVPAPAAAVADSGTSSTSPTDRSPRIVREVYLSREVQNPARELAAIQKLAVAAGGLVESSGSTVDAEYVNTASLMVSVPVERWPEVESGIELGAQGSLDSQRIERVDQVGDGPPHVSFVVELSEPAERTPNFLVGVMGGVSLPLDQTGLGMAQQVGLRAMGADRDGVVEALYAPANKGYASGQVEPWMVKITVGDAVYSEFMGDGERTFLNPYIGGQLGYAYRGESWFILQAELGLELLHVGHVIWDVYARPVGAFRKGAVGLSVEAGTGLVVPF